MFLSIISDGKTALMELPLMNRILHVFWLLGPFILLIERTPADAFISILALAFVLRVAMGRDFFCFKQFWVRATFAFWGVCLLSAVSSSNSLYAFGEAFVWIRFPLFAMAVVFWLAQDKRIFYLMLLSTALGFLIMCVILTAEIIHNGEIGQRLSWPYGDLVSGNYLTKVGLPIMLIFSVTSVSHYNQNSIFSGLFLLMGITVMFFSGERINTLILIGGCTLAGIVCRPKWGSLVAVCLFGGVLITVLFFSTPEIYERFVSSFIAQLPTGEHSPYYRAMAPAWLAFEQNPLLGIGTANFRNWCPDTALIISKLECHPHPHNYYFQLLGETGVIGLAFGTVFLWSIVWKCFKAGRWANDNVALATSWIVPFMFFWPILSTADFFGQWNNAFMWSSIAIALGATNLGNKAA
jgi:O-antigen ligase